MIPVPVPLPAILAGDTWEGLTIGPIQFDGAQPPASLQSCRLYFNDAETGKFVYGLKSAIATGFGRILIVDAALWIARINPLILPLPAGKYRWDYETTDTDGVVRTPYKGTLTVKQDESHD